MLNYFTFLPTIKYTFANGEYTVADIFSRVGFKPSFFSSTSLYYEDKLDPITSPDKLSDKIYGTYDYYWLLMLANNVYDVNSDWPPTQDEFNRELENNRKKLVYYIYENGEIAPNDIIFYNQNSYGVVESWNPFYKSIVIKENYNLPTTSMNGRTFKIRRINKNGSYTELTNYCNTNSTTFTTFGFQKYLDSVYQIYTSSQQILNPFLSTVDGNVTKNLQLDTCDSSDKTNFQNSLIYQIVNGYTVNNVFVESQEYRLTKEYNEKTNIKIIKTNLAPLYENTVKILFSDPTSYSQTMFKIN